MDIRKFIDKYEEYKTKNGTKSSVSEITVVVLDFSRWHVSNPVGGFARNDHSVHSRACQPSLEGFSGAKKRKKKKKSKENEEIIFKYKYFLRKAAPHLTEFKRGSSASFYLKGKEEVLRISNHNAAAKNFLSRGETKGCSVVIKKGKDRSNTFKSCEEVDLVEYVFFDFHITDEIYDEIIKAIDFFVENKIWGCDLSDIADYTNKSGIKEERKDFLGNLPSLPELKKLDINNPLDKYEALCESVQLALSAGAVTNHDIKRMCQSIGIDSEDVGQIKEKIERALYLTAKKICGSDLSVREKYEKIISLYNRQPIVGAQKTLRQMAKQQYSTSLPVAYLMSEFVRRNGNDNMYFEPSAGNGFLTVALPSSQTICNEVDELRLQNLRLENYKKVMAQDGRNPFEFGKIFDGVVTNPPFLKEVDRMIFNALDAMKDNGRAAILRDGWNLFENYLGTELRNRNLSFYDKLIAEYNVVKIINLDSRKVYAKQGTGFFMCVILIDGRRPTPNYTNKNRVYNPNIDIKNLCGFEELWDIFQPYITCGAETEKSQILIKELKYLNKQ